MSIIKGEEKNISKVLSSDFEFYIPDYQRPYSWTREQAAELFDDLWTFSLTSAGSGFLSAAIGSGRWQGPGRPRATGVERLLVLWFRVKVRLSDLSTSSKAILPPLPLVIRRSVVVGILLFFDFPNLARDQS